LGDTLIHKKMYN